MKHKQSRGEFIGGQPPYGYRVENGKLVSHEAEQAVLALVQQFRDAGYSLREIAAELDRNGIRSRGGKVFAAVQIQRMQGAA